MAYYICVSMLYVTVSSPRLSAYFSYRLFKVQIIAFSLVALKMVWCCSFFSSEYSHVIDFESFVFKISESCLTFAEMSFASEPANQNVFFVSGNLSKWSLAVLTRCLSFHQSEGSNAI